MTTIHITSLHHVTLIKLLHAEKENCMLRSGCQKLSIMISQEHSLVLSCYGCCVAAFTSPEATRQSDERSRHCNH